MSVLIAFRCPDDLALQIQSQVEATGNDKTTVLINWLRQSAFSFENSQVSCNSDMQMSYSQDVLDARITQLLDNRITQLLDECITQTLDNRITQILDERLGKLKAR